MSDFVFFDEDLADNSNYAKVVERLKKDVFLNNRLIQEGTIFSVTEAEDEE